MEMGKAPVVYGTPVGIYAQSNEVKHMPFSAWCEEKGGEGKESKVRIIPGGRVEVVEMIYGWRSGVQFPAETEKVLVVYGSPADQIVLSNVPVQRRTVKVKLDMMHAIIVILQVAFKYSSGVICESELKENKLMHLTALQWKERKHWWCMVHPPTKQCIWNDVFNGGLGFNSPPNSKHCEFKNLFNGTGEVGRGESLTVVILVITSTLQLCSEDTGSMVVYGTPADKIKTVKEMGKALVVYGTPIGIVYCCARATTTLNHGWGSIPCRCMSFSARCEEKGVEGKETRVRIILGCRVEVVEMIYESWLNFLPVSNELVPIILGEAAYKLNQSLGMESTGGVWYTRRKLCKLTLLYQ
ncbi:hypothetical protein B0H19DRAFT_1228375 [Mycena capillaripes]|nr:hypothetical protein B0H19DRAFT_1228375 [Mycena capillaripes]